MWLLLAHTFKTAAVYCVYLWIWRHHGSKTLKTRNFHTHLSFESLVLTETSADIWGSFYAVVKSYVEGVNSYIILQLYCSGGKWKSIALISGIIFWIRLFFCFLAYWTPWAVPKWMSRSVVRVGRQQPEGWRFNSHSQFPCSPGTVNDCPPLQCMASVSMSVWPSACVCQQVPTWMG